MALVAAAVGGCASQSGELTTAATPTIAPPAATAMAPAETVSRLPPAEGYRLTADEMALDCRKLTGRMAVRIVQVRDYEVRAQSTALSRSVQSAVKPVFGGSGAGSDPDGRHAEDRAKLEAYNRRLAEKGCPNFDLEAELDPNAKDPPRTRPLAR